MRWGHTAVESNLVSLSADAMYLYDVGIEMLDDRIIGSVVAHLGGHGGGNGQQVLRPVFLEAGNPSSLVVGEEVAIDEGSPPAWRHLTFDRPGIVRAGHAARIGLWCGPADALTLISHISGVDSVAFRYTVPYEGAPIPLPAGADQTYLPSIFAVGTTPWRDHLPPGVTEDELAGLPVGASASLLNGPAATVEAPAVCGWHYRAADPPPPSSAIVRTGGPLEHLVGQRIRVTANTPTGPASVLVVVTDEQPFDATLDEDLSLARDAFVRIGDLWVDSVTVTVEVLA